MANQSLIECDRQEFHAQLKRMELLGITKIHENQRKIAEKVHEAVMANNYGTLYTMVIAKTQSGKTGSMLEVIKTAIEFCGTPPKNIFVITGLSSSEWKDQTKSRFPDILKPQIFHNNDVDGKLEMSLRGKQNVLIVIDEMHMAAKETQTIARTFRNCNLENPEFTMKNQIRIVEYSATPDGTLRDRLRLQERSKIVLAEPGRGYIGPFELMDRGVIFQAEDLSEKHNVAKLHSHIMEKFHEPKYHIIRMHTQGMRRDQIYKNFDELRHIGDFETKGYHGEGVDIVDINTTLSMPPTKHTFILIKDMLRCAKTLVKTHIGVVYERLARNVNDTTIIQGLLGRMTGYDVPDHISIFTNINTVERYRRLWETGFVNDDIPWNSNTSKSNTYATDEWCDTTNYEIKRERLEVSYRLFPEDGILRDFVKKYMNWTPKKGSGINIKELKDYKGQDIANRKWGISRKTTRRVARGCDGVWVVLWLKDAFDVPPE
jgi:hypothetical protein